jgi:hypothetical protein
VSGTVHQLPTRRPVGRLLSKKQLAAELGRSPRWIELKMRDEGLPVEPRASEQEHARFDLVKVRAWLEARAAVKTMTLEERVASLETRLGLLEHELGRPMR